MHRIVRRSEREQSLIFLRRKCPTTVRSEWQYFSPARVVNPAASISRARENILQQCGERRRPPRGGIKRAGDTRGTADGGGTAKRASEKARRRQRNRDEILIHGSRTGLNRKRSRMVSLRQAVASGFTARRCPRDVERERERGSPCCRIKSAKTSSRDRSVSRPRGLSARKLRKSLFLLFRLAHLAPFIMCSL